MRRNSKSERKRGQTQKSNVHVQHLNREDTSHQQDATHYRQKKIHPLPPNKGHPGTAAVL